MKKIDFEKLNPLKISMLEDKSEIKNILEGILELEKDFAYLSFLTKKINPELKGIKMQEILEKVLKASEKIISKIDNRDSIDIISRIKEKEYNHKVNLFKVNPELIANKCSPRHIESVIEHSLVILNKGNRLLKDTLSLNPKAQEIGLGKLFNLRTSAYELDNSFDIDEDVNIFENKFKQLNVKKKIKRAS